jgi:hypothetical protein
MTGFAETCRAQLAGDIGHMGGVEVRPAPAAAPQDDVAGIVAGRLEDRRHALLGHRREPVR